MKTTQNPLRNPDNTNIEIDLVNRSLKGDRKALNQLLEEHNVFIYNIAIKMIGDAERAKDITQDVLIKLTTNLAKYDSSKGSFRAWLYRIVYHFILDQKKSKSENNIKSFSQFFQVIGDVEDEDAQFADEQEEVVFTEEVKIKCTTGMLLCLSREQRFLYVIGELFQVDHKLGAEIFGITPASYRKRLSRIRQELYQWMNNKCGLVNKSNPCRCAKKTRGFIKRGFVDPDHLVWNQTHKHRIEDFSSQQLTELQLSSDAVYTQIYQEHPLKEPKTVDEVLSIVLGDKNLKEFLEI